METKVTWNRNLGSRAVKALVLTGALLPMAAWAGITERIDLASDGTEANKVGYDQYDGRFSANGRYVVFSSTSTNLAPGEYNGTANPFLRDTVTDTTTRVFETGYDGELAWRTDGYSYQNTDVKAADISGDGRYVVLASSAGNIVPGVAGYWPSVFLHDLRTGTNEGVCYDTDGVIKDYCYFGGISHDGRFVAFSLYVYSSYKIPYVRDRLLGKTERLDIDVNGNPVGGTDSTPHGMSADGRYVLFSSNISTLVANDTNGKRDLFVRDRVLGVTKRVNVSSDGTQSNGTLTNYPAISAGGRVVAFVANAADLVPNGVSRYIVYAHDMETGVTERISGTGDDYTLYASYPSISADGRYVAFSDQGNTLVPDDTNGTVDAFVYDRVMGVTDRVSVSTAGEQANAGGLINGISQDGSKVLFTSDSTNLVDFDLNDKKDLFMRSICRVSD